MTTIKKDIKKYHKYILKNIKIHFQSVKDLVIPVYIYSQTIR